MTRPRPEEIEFRPDDIGPVLVVMAALAGARSGWVNLRPVIAPEHVPPAPGLFAIFGGSVHKVPTATWIPGRVERSGGVGPTTVGLQHAGGPRVVAQLRERNLAVPAGWRVVQDHPRRGLVAKVPADGADAEVVHWLVRAGGALCAVPDTGRWLAQVHRPAGSSRA